MQLALGRIRCAVRCTAVPVAAAAVDPHAAGLEAGHPARVRRAAHAAAPPYGHTVPEDDEQGYCGAAGAQARAQDACTEAPGHVKAVGGALAGAMAGASRVRDA